VDDARFCQSNAQRCVIGPVVAEPCLILGQIPAQNWGPGSAEGARRGIRWNLPDLLLVEAKAVAHVDAEPERWLVAVDELLLTELAQALVEFPSLAGYGEVERE
jgi:hypothetical protein